MHKEEFAAAGCQQFVVSGTEYGEVRQFGNFSFLEIYEVGLATGSFWKLNTRIDHWPHEWAGHATLLSIRNHLEIFRRVLL
jgi:hypothetical protein